MSGNFKILRKVSMCLCKPIFGKSFHFPFPYFVIFILQYFPFHVVCLYFILTDKSAGKRPLGRLKRRWEDNIRMDLEEIGINAGDWVDSAQDGNYWIALVNVALSFRVP